MEPLTPIPVPPSHQWREFRIKRVPLIFFCTALVAVVFIWKDYISAPSMTGEVEVVSADVISAVPGTLAELEVKRFEKVTKGQVIGKLVPMDPEILKASLTAVEMDLKILRARMAMDRERNQLNQAQLRLDYMDQRVQLATAKVDLQSAEREYQRHLKLKEEKLASESEFEWFRNLRDIREQDVAERTKLIAELEKQLSAVVTPTGTPDPFDTAITAQEAKLLLSEGPISLKAPMDGVVSAVANEQGEQVMAGVPIVTISSPKPGRILGFARQPLTKVPKPGDSIQVRTRSAPRKTVMAKVLHVGSEMQPVTSPMRIRGYDNSQERGLPFQVSMPEGVELFPGELVDLIVQQ
jgi:multidrug resistance efflux pump